MRTFSIACLVSAAIVSGGCFQATTLVRVKGDGSGTIHQTMAMAGPALAQLRMFAAAGRTNGKPLELFSEEQARLHAEAMGPGVRVLSTKAIHTADLEGQEYELAFDDITKLHIDQEKGPPSPSELGSNQPPAGDPSKQIRFAMERSTRGNAVLKVILPPYKMPGQAMGGINSSQDQPTPEQMAMIKQLVGGAHIAIAIEPVGTVVRSTSPYVDGGKVTLLDIELDRLFENQETMARLNRAKTAEEVRAVLKDIPGLKISVDPEITIEFTPAR